jgi:hypothetical protein
MIAPQILNGVLPISDSIPALQSARTDAYLRAGYGDPERGPWFQAIAGSLGYNIKHKASSSLTATGDTVPDSTLFRAQYVLSGGFTSGPLRLEAAQRLRVGNGQRLWTPSARAEFTTGPLALEAFAEGRGPDSLNRVEVTARLTPLPFVSFLGTVGRSSDRHAGDSTITSNFLRGEAGVRLFRLWLAGGVVRRDSALLLPPRIYSDSLFPIVEPAATGLTARIDGTIYKAIRTNIIGIRWNDSSGFYRPRYQTRSELYLQTNWLSRFPSGNFGVLMSFWHEYRSRTLFPLRQSGALTIASVPDSRTYNFHLEIRIITATLFYQFRNMSGRPYEIVPGYLMPRLNQFYGVRWDFWN